MKINKINNKNNKYLYLLSTILLSYVLIKQNVMSAFS